MSTDSIPAQQVAELRAGGLLRREIAARLGMSVDMVDYYLYKRPPTVTVARVSQARAEVIAREVARLRGLGRPWRAVGCALGLKPSAAAYYAGPRCRAAHRVGLTPPRL